jgi:hypothetical protein
VWNIEQTRKKGNMYRKCKEEKGEDEKKNSIKRTK